jgi:hypothetical protein
VNRWLVFVAGLLLGAALHAVIGALVVVAIVLTGVVVVWSLVS